MHTSLIPVNKIQPYPVTFVYWDEYKFESTVEESNATLLRVAFIRYISDREFDTVRGSYVL